MSDHRASSCRNCGQELETLPQAHYCPHCGQETLLHPPTLWEFIHEFITHYVALEGTLWRTLAMLLLKPGQLTSEYFHGRRKRYVLPLRIYLTASFVFFLAAKMLAGGPASITVSEGLRPSAVAVETAGNPPESVSNLSSSGSSTSARPTASVEVDAHGTAERDRYLGCAEPGATCSWMDRTLGTILRKSLQASYSDSDWQSKLIAMAPYALFLMLPLFAGLLKLSYWGRSRLYGEHFVFSLHLHTFWFLILLIVQFLPEVVAGLPLLTIPVYGCIAMRNVYGGRWGPTVARAVMLSAVYSLLLGVGAAALAVWLVLGK